MSRHPSNDDLQQWLESGEPARVGKHVDNCEQCMETLERLSGLDEELVADLTVAFEVPVDVERRAVRQVDKRLRNEAAFISFIELFTVGWSATKTILDIEEDSNE